MLPGADQAPGYADMPATSIDLMANSSFSHETVFADLRLAAMKREREPSSKAYRQDRFENTERAAKETIEAEQRARREKTKRLKELRLSQQGATDPATK